MASYRDSHLAKSSDYDQDLKSDAFDSFMAENEERFLKLAIPRLFPNGIPRYLDFACGTGRITSLVENYAKDSYAVDVSENMQELAKQKCRNTTFYLQDITANPLTIDPVQLVTAFRFFGNAEDNLRISALGALKKKIVPGGYLVINNHRNPSSLYLKIDNLRGGNDPADLSPKKLNIMLKNSGFSIITIYGIGWWFIHRRLNRKAVCQSWLLKLMEPISRLPLVSNICPDYILIAKKL